MKQGIINRCFKYRIGYLILLIIYKILVDVIYIYGVSPLWGYMNLGTDINRYKWILSFVIILLTGGLIDWKTERISGMAIQVLFLISIVPLSSYYSLNNNSTSFFAASITSFLITVFLTRINVAARKQSIRITKVAFVFFWFAVVVVMLMIISPAIDLFNLNYKLFNIFDSELIYSTRNAISSGQLKGVASYCYVWTYRIIIPVSIGMCLHYKKRLVLVLLTCIQFIIYLNNPHKEIVLGIVLLYVTYGFAKIIPIGSQFMILGIPAMLISLVAPNAMRGKLPYYIWSFLSRLLYVPASVKFMHHEFFSTHPKLFFSEGRIGRILGMQYPYKDSVGIVVGRHFFDVESNNNTGWLAYAFDDLGYPGMILVGIALAVVLLIFDILINDGIRHWASATLVYPIILLNEGAFPQWMLSCGIIPMMILLCIIRMGIGGRRGQENRYTSSFACAGELI